MVNVVSAATGIAGARNASSIPALPESGLLRSTERAACTGRRTCEDGKGQRRRPDTTIPA
jgi:hypothetical protein